MIPVECKRLAEVDFPIAVVSRHAAREKSIRHGHPSTLHLWWARRPLAACRAMLLALLLPDPCDPACPSEFKEKARELLGPIPGPREPGDKGLREALLRFIGDFADWDLSANPAWLEAGRGLVKAAHPEETPLVVDPFAGGGSIPLEALRLGCDAFASDLNPVACLILKVLLEDIPRHGPELADELRRAGAEIKAAAEKELAQYYPPDPDGAQPIAYLWARTVRCEAPNCGAEIPLVRSFWLCRKANRKKALRYQVVREAGQAPTVEFEIFEPDSDDEVPAGTVSRARATCPCCKTVLPPDRVRVQLREQHGGADVAFDADGKRTGGARLLAVVSVRPGESGRTYRSPTSRDYAAVRESEAALRALEAGASRGGQTLLPDEVVPLMSGTFNAPIYGMARWRDLFTARQSLALVIISAEVKRRAGSARHGSRFALACTVSRLADKNASLSVWNQVGEKIEHVFGRQALPMVWDFAEVAVLSGSTGNYLSGVELIHEVSLAWAVAQPVRPGAIALADARTRLLPHQAASIWFTDPPYYNAVPYADLSDFFLVWLRRCLVGEASLRDPYDTDNSLSPKEQELCEMARWDPQRYSHKDGTFYERGIADAFAQGRSALSDCGVGCVVFAHKTTEGWEALLSALVVGRWVITASWPVATERPGRLRSQESAALATSVHLVCRPRSEAARIGDWADVLRELPKRVGDWMERLQTDGVRGADLVFACIGPALEIYSRYSHVETPEGREVPLAEYLEKVWEVVGRLALEQVLGTAEARARNGAAGTLEEDARLTALFLWTLQSTVTDASPSGEKASAHPDDDPGNGRADADDGDAEDEDVSPGKTKGYALVFDVVRRFAQPLGIRLPDWEGRIIETRKGTVRLLGIAERASVLFGREGATAVADRWERGPEGPEQMALVFAGTEAMAPAIHGPVRRRERAVGSIVAPGDEAFQTRQEATTLDRVHATMILQAAGRANALRALLKAEQERGPDFGRLANALSALYPRNSEEKRLLDAMLLLMPK